jgi:hypothetical protein
MADALAELVDAGVDVRRACKLVGRPRSTHHWRRRLKPAAPTQRRPRPRPANALSDAERDRVRALLRDPAFVDKAPAQVWAHLLDHGLYLCSQSTTYRILRERGNRASAVGRRPTRRRSSPSWWPTHRRGMQLGHHQAAGPAARRLVRPVRV